MVKYDGNLLNYPFTVRIKRSHKKGEYQNVRIESEDIFTFDIETTSFFYDSDKKPYLYEAGKDPEYYCGVYAGALPYVWQFSINDRYYYGRDIKDFERVLADFPPDMNVIIWVHNLSFEWHFLDFLTWHKVFAKSKHKPIKCSCSEYPNIEFRCTLSLENKSLAEWGNELGLPKLVGYLDYNQMRTPLTPLTEDEFKYAERDLEVMYLGLKRELEEYKSLWKIPLTATGKVRRIVKDMLMNDKDYVNYVHKLVPESPYDYKTSMLIYQGGYTHANRQYVGYTLYNDDGEHGGHVDYTSSYPYEMCVSKMPCSGWAYVDNVMPPDESFEDYAYKMHLIFYGLRSELQNTYIAGAHCTCQNPTIDNGKISAADVCEIWCTEQDYQVIKQAYTWHKLEVVEMYEARKDYLPLDFIKYVLELFEVKAKNPKFKPLFNSLYGMAVTALIQSEVVWDTEAEDWSTKRLTQDMITEHLEKLRKFKDHRYFLNYDWGCWISNGARCRLWNDIIIPYDKYVIYADTDSAFTSIKIDFSEYNDRIRERLKRVCLERGLDYEKTKAYKKNGKLSELGCLTNEETWTEFRTLGSKRYCERWKSDGKLHLTVAGINKEAVACLNDDIENFADGLVFDKDSEDVTKLLHTYFDKQPEITFPDGYVSTQKRGVNLRPNGYRLTTDPSFDDILTALSDRHVEAYDNHLRGIWFDDIDEIVEEYFGNTAKGAN